MPDKKVLGKNVVTQIEVDGIFYNLLCAKTATFSNDQEEIEITSRSSGISRQFMPWLNSATLEISGITEMENDNKVGVGYLLNEQIRRRTHNMRMLFTANDGTVMGLSFSAFVRTLSTSRDRQSYSQSSVSFRVTGGITISDEIEPPAEGICEVQDTLNKLLLEGATSVQDNLLIQIPDYTYEILTVWREGNTLYETSGTPGNMQFNYDETTGTISFDAANPGNPGNERVSIMYKITEN